MTILVFRGGVSFIIGKAHYHYPTLLSGSLQDGLLEFMNMQISASGQKLNFHIRIAVKQYAWVWHNKVNCL